MQPRVALELIKEIVASGKLISADLAELNPPLDQGDMTAKLAAKLAYEFITGY
jgi:formiminoglutamase